MTPPHLRCLMLVALAVAPATVARAIQLIMPVNATHNLDGGPIDIDYHKSGNCGPATGILNGTDFADAQFQGTSDSWDVQTYTYARSMASYQGGGGFAWSDVYTNNHITYLVKSAPPQVQYFKFRAISFSPAFPCNALNPPPHTGDTSMTIEFEELPVFTNGFELGELEDWTIPPP